jgi:thiol-disulfide isomerase/thioredoxin
MYANAKTVLLIILFMVPAFIFPQEKNTRYKDPKLNIEILYGNCDRAGLEEGEFGQLFRQYYKIYEPDMKVISQIRPLQEGIDILIVLGTWCSDSQEQVPKFFKVLDKTRFPKKNIQMICVSSGKEAGLVDLVNYDIVKVPTFIFYRKGREIGRIIETPYTTLESDLLMFLSDL